MPTRETRLDLGRRLGRGLETRLAEELRSARLSAGLRQVDVGRAAGMSHTQISRIERGRFRGVTVDQASRIGVALGLRLSVQLYPFGDPIRDVAHVRLLERFRTRIAPTWRWRTEVPLPIAGDRRAWDAVISNGNTTIGVEAETRLHDVQALERRLALKRRDGRVDHAILLVARTRQNTDAVATAGSGLRAELPMGPRALLAAVGEGRDPGGSGLIML